MFMNKQGPTQTSIARVLGMRVLIDAGMIISTNLT